MVSMADIELVIKIPKRVYNYIRKYEHIANSDVLDIKDVIINGTPLPKGHGRLIDADYITKDLNTLQDSFTINMDNFNLGVISINCNAPTIIEADTESEG